MNDWPSPNSSKPVSKTKTKERAKSQCVLEKEDSEESVCYSVVFLYFLQSSCSLCYGCPSIFPAYVAFCDFHS